jgi:predicted TIM-barrel fold metal-dependent hydrolase
LIWLSVLDLAIRGYYGVDGLSETTYRDLSEKIRNEYRPGIYKRFLRGAAGVDKAITDLCDEHPVEELVDRSILIPAKRVDPWLRIKDIGDLDNLSKESDVNVTTVSAIRKAIDSIIRKWHDRGIVAAKCGSAYDRTLEFKFVSEQDAQRALDVLYKGEDSDAARVLQDYVFHIVVQVCTDHNIPIQIHTGLLGSSNFGNLKQTHPMLLADVFARYTKAKFDVFHAGYPWMREMGTLGRINTSVYANLCWAQFICPVAAVSAMDEWLDSMPASKIFAFGGDYWFPEGSYGHSVITRTNVGEVLANRVERGRMTMDEAKTVARMILRDNVIELFGLQ